MRILFIHNAYRQQGGEDSAFDQEVKLLGQSEDVKTIVFQNFPGIHGAGQFLLSVWNIHSASKIGKILREFRPDIIHVHNWHYAIGPLIIRLAKKKNVPIILTLPNYRLICPSAILLHKGKLFLDSIHAGFPWKAIRKRVYRDSFIQTFWLSFVIWFHKKLGTWKMADRYIVFTDLAKNILLSSTLALKESQFEVKPNFLEDPGIKVQPRDIPFLFIGRLSEEKGIECLINAFAGRHTKLLIAGDGPFKSKVIELSKKNSQIEYLGRLDRLAVQEMMSRSSVLIFPSVCYEGMPMTIVEAFACGTPVIASNIGTMATMIKDGYNGLLFEAGNALDLSEKIKYWEYLSPCEKQQFALNARATYESKYTPEINKKQMISIYNSVIMD